MTRRQVLGAMCGIGVVALATACQAPAAPAVPTAPNPLIKPRAASGVELTPVLASSELARGRNRFGLGLIDARNQPIVEGQVSLEFFKLLDAQGTNAQKRFDALATFRAVEVQAKGVWTAQVDFNEIGAWGAQVSVVQSGQAPRVARLNFQVQPQFSAPGYGDPAPRSASMKLQDVGGDASRVCTSQPPCPLHAMSIAEALQPGDKPLLILFATPALCTSATCAPELSAVLKLHDGDFADKARFVHVEIYQQPFESRNTSPTVDEWKLPSEPWVFVVDRGGIVRDRFEGAAPAEEVGPALKALI